MIRIAAVTLLVIAIGAVAWIATSTILFMRSLGDMEDVWDDDDW